MQVNIASLKFGRFVRIVFRKKDGTERVAIARTFGDSLPDYYREYQRELIRDGKRKPSTVKAPSYYGNVRFVDVTLYNRAIRELKDAEGIRRIDESTNPNRLRARALDASLRQFKATRLMVAPFALIEYADALADA